MQRYKITVTGKVQGVFFRQTAKEVADRLSLTGFARNEPDGSVHIEVEGEKAALQDFLEWCRKGPKAATVSAVRYTEGPIAGFIGFKTE